MTRTITCDRTDGTCTSQVVITSDCTDEEVREALRAIRWKVEERHAGREWHWCPEEGR